MLRPDTYRAGRHIVKDANLQHVANWLGCRMASAPAVIERDLSVAIQTAPATLQERIRVITSLRSGDHTASQIDNEFERISEIEADIKDFFEPSSKEKDSLQDDSLAQLSFTHTDLKSLNHIPFALMGMAIFKIWVVPAITIISPLIAWVLPYILLKFVYSLPISHDQYSTILKSMWSGNMSPPAMFGGSDEAPTVNLWTPKSMAQAFFFAFSFIQSLVQPIQNAMHLHKTDAVFLSMGQKILNLRAAVGRLRSLGVPLSKALDDIDDDHRRAFLLVKEQPERLRIVLGDLARLEVLWRMSQKVGLRPVDLVEGAPFHLEDAVDISLINGIPSSVTLGGESRHAVITGPNGGGKSSFMRAVLQATLLAHAYGHAPVAAATMPRIRWIASGLQLRDTPGVLSMFETEVKFAAMSLARQDGPGLVLFDELFHSTNAPDGTRTATLFLQQLWARSNVLSIVSTHIFPLVEAAPAGVQAICCQATDGEEGVRYSYRVEPGICRVSSVKTVWERFGLSIAP